MGTKVVVFFEIHRGVRRVHTNKAKGLIGILDQPPQFQHNNNTITPRRSKIFQADDGVWFIIVSLSYTIII